MADSLLVPTVVVDEISDGLLFDIGLDTLQRQVEHGFTRYNILFCMNYYSVLCAYVNEETSFCVDLRQDPLTMTVEIRQTSVKLFKVQVFVYICEQYVNKHDITLHVLYNILLKLINVCAYCVSIINKVRKTILK